MVKCSTWLIHIFTLIKYIMVECFYKVKEDRKRTINCLAIGYHLNMCPVKFFVPSCSSHTVTGNCTIILTNAFYFSFNSYICTKYVGRWKKKKKKISTFWVIIIRRKKKGEVSFNSHISLLLFTVWEFVHIYIHIDYST